MIEQITMNPVALAVGIAIGVTMASVAGACYFAAWRKDTIARAARENRIVLGKAEFQVSGGRIRR